MAKIKQNKIGFLEIVFIFLFLFSWLFSLIITTIESFTYIGAFQKHFGVNSIIIFLPMIFLGLILVVLFVWKKVDLDGWLFIYEGLLPLVLFLTYLFLKIVNKLTHANFVFSRIHVQPNNIFWLVLVSLLPFLISGITKIYSRKIPRLHLTLTLLSISLVFFNLIRIYKMEFWAYQFMFKNPRASYDDKMRRAVGPVFYNFTKFIDENTSSNAAILLPPQVFPWPQTGNGAFIRYFIYPRKVGNGGEYLPGEKFKFADFDYILLAWGETETTEENYTHGWPKFDVPAEKIIFMNKDGSFGGEKMGDYNYLDYKDKEVWGLIKIKH